MWCTHTCTHIRHSILSSPSLCTLDCNKLPVAWEQVVKNSCVSNCTFSVCTVRRRRSLWTLCTVLQRCTSRVFKGWKSCTVQGTSNFSFQSCWFPSSTMMCLMQTCTQCRYRATMNLTLEATSMSSTLGRYTGVSLVLRLPSLCQHFVQRLLETSVVMDRSERARGSLLIVFTHSYDWRSKHKPINRLDWYDSTSDTTKINLRCSLVDCVSLQL